MIKLYSCRFLTPVILGNFPAKHYAPVMRKAQNSKWAFKHVHLGIKHFKANNKIEAFQCLNQALNMDPQNVEGLVARGNSQQLKQLSKFVLMGL